MIKKLGPCPTCKSELEAWHCDYCDCKVSDYGMTLYDNDLGKSATLCSEKCMAAFKLNNWNPCIRLGVSLDGQ